MNVIKRDGSKEVFDYNKITKAIFKAYKEVYNRVDEDKLLERAEALTAQVVVFEDMSIEHIQDTVEKLITKDDFTVGKAFMLYRAARAEKRERARDSVIKGIIQASATEITKENANMNSDTAAGMMMKFAGEIAKEYAMAHVVDKKSKELIKENFIHIHDSDYLAIGNFNCFNHPLDKILHKGFDFGHGSARSAKRIETAVMQAVISLQAVQNECYGGQGISAWDYYLAPFVRLTFLEELEKVETANDEKYPNLRTRKVIDYTHKELGDLEMEDRIFQFCINNTRKRVHQAMESFIHNMNSIASRGGNQVVFSSINFGTDVTPEGRCIIRETLLATYEGVGNGQTAIFPISIFQSKTGYNYLSVDPNYDLYQLACKVTAKRFFPNFINLDASFNQDDRMILGKDNSKYVVSTMGCRTRVYENIHGDFGSTGRGNLSFTTINLPGLALSMPNVNDAEKYRLFMIKLEEIARHVTLQLHTRMKQQKELKIKQYPMCMGGYWNTSEGKSPEDSIGEVLEQGTLGVGFVGLAECLMVLNGSHHAQSTVSQAMGLAIVGKLKEVCDIAKMKYQHNYAVIGTPAESMAGKSVKKDRIKYGIIEGITDKDYYTNSNHVPVWYNCTAAEKAAIEAPYHKLTLGGHIFYTELDGDVNHNPYSVMAIVDLMKKNDMGYGSINHTRSRCLDCGNESGDEFHECPKCHSTNVSVIQRITGYLVGTTDRWNAGKIAELKDRVKHNV